jgi:hypothetical protein
MMMAALIALAVVFGAGGVAFAVVRARKRKGEKMSNARFEIRPSLVVFHDDKPGQNVRLFIRDQQCPFRGDASSFDDAKRKYAWAFEGVVSEGDAVTFVCDEGAVMGVVRGDQVEIEVAVEDREAVDIVDIATIKAARKPDIAKAAKKAAPKKGKKK